MDGVNQGPRFPWRRGREPLPTMKPCARWRSTKTAMTSGASGRDPTQQEVRIMNGGQRMAHGSVIGAALVAALLTAGCGRDKTSDPSGPAEYSKEEAQARLDAGSDLKLMAVAMQSFQEQYDALPPADGARVEKLPELEGMSW